MFIFSPGYKCKLLLEKLIKPKFLLCIVVNCLYMIKIVFFNYILTVHLDQFSHSGLLQTKYVYNRHNIIYICTILQDSWLQGLL